VNDNGLTFLSPPVVQQARADGFTVSIEVSRLCMGRIEWGFESDGLIHTAVSAHAGLVDAHERCLMIAVTFPVPLDVGQPVFYRVVAESLEYASAYEVGRGKSVTTSVRRLKLPHREQAALSLAVINDTHEDSATVAALARRIDALQPDMLVWNGDVCRDFPADANPAALVLRPGADATVPSEGGWASTRPLVYVAGNHDVRGEGARMRPLFLASGPHAGLPYNTAARIGPLALICLDTGEDKPDHHPVFAGTAAYEPYRERQAAWLATQLARPEISQAPFKLAFSHIPLRGLTGQNDGTSLEGYARFSAHGARLWLPQLSAAGFQAIVSGHTHEWRYDKPTAEQPITQVVGGGPKHDSVTLIFIEATTEKLTIQTQDLEGTTLGSETWE
jgi:acid phosphatase type 7